MKIAIINTQAMHIYGGAEFLADSLRDKLQEYGHQAISIKVPFQWETPGKILEQILAIRMLNLDAADLVIGLKFPTYYINHPNKRMWLLHQFRQVYDFWGTDYQGVPDDVRGLEVRSFVSTADNKYLREVSQIYTNSRVVSNRLKMFNDIDSEVLYPPLMEAEKFHCRSYGDYIFYPSRINQTKRQLLAIEAMQYTKSGVKLVLAGHPETRDYIESLRNLVFTQKLEEKVTILSDFISQEEKRAYFADCLGTIYIPFDEDSYGYVTLESYHSLKPVISCTDSGGTDVVVKDQITGFMVAPDPVAIAAAMDKLYTDKMNAQKMGEEGLRHLSTLGITWENVINKLTQ